MRLVRLQGFGNTSVDQLCQAAGVTKGAFFHHFVSKEMLGVALAEYWSASTGRFFAEAEYHRRTRASDRVLGYIDLRIDLLDGPAEQFSCVAGTILQESFHSSDVLRQACGSSILANAAALVDDIAAALAEAGRTGDDPAELARYVQAAIQGAFILAKTQQPSQSAQFARAMLCQLRRHFELLLTSPEKESPT